MKTRFRLIQRGERGGAFYCVDTQTGQRTSLQTTDPDAARQIVFAKNQALRQPAINLQIARAYLAAGDPAVATRTWQHVMDEILKQKKGSTRERWKSLVQSHDLDPIRDLAVLETRPEHFLRLLDSCPISTNVYLRRIQNFALDMNWLPWPVVPKKRWPAVRFGDKRAITAEEHRRIVEREPNPEFRAFYELLWQVGGGQSDVATLTAENIDWPNQVISYRRLKTKQMCHLHFGEEAAAILQRLPKSGSLFPRLAALHEKHRAKEFHRRCRSLAITGISLHSYRYAWAERAKIAGMPERFAQEALGHGSKAVHRAYAGKAHLKLPSLESYERAQAQRTVIAFPGTAANAPTAPEPKRSEGQVADAGSR